MAQNCEILVYKHYHLSLGYGIESIGDMISDKANNLEKNVDGSFVVNTSPDSNVSFMTVIKEESKGKEFVAVASAPACTGIKEDDSSMNEKNSFPTGPKFGDDNDDRVYGVNFVNGMHCSGNVLHDYPYLNEESVLLDEVGQQQIGCASSSFKDR